MGISLSFVSVGTGNLNILAMRMRHCKVDIFSGIMSVKKLYGMQN